ncbi:hypothetical protein RJ55_03487 [Drechmeria coniospora]|nr:hypothetical protein RJ55_03487 [Drechmeria coniospora]
MSTTVPGRPRPQPQPQPFPPADTFDPDEVVPRDSPLMQALRPKLELSPSPPPDIPPAQIRPSSGDAVLVSYLDNGRHPDIARAAGDQTLPELDLDEPARISASPKPDESPSRRDAATEQHAFDPDMTTSTLRHLATDALQAVSTDRPPHRAASNDAREISVDTGRLSICNERVKNAAAYSPGRPSAHLQTDTRSPSARLAMPATGELPPLQIDSPKDESSGHNLPSIRLTFGDINRIPSTEPSTPADVEVPALRAGTGAAFKPSPSAAAPQLPLMPLSHVSPPISPNEPYHRSLPSPPSLSASSPYSYYQTTGLGHRPSIECTTVTVGETPNTDRSASTPATVASVADRMSIDGITNPPVASYICGYSGCTAPPFQTQYLLNSHRNVHSSARPHFCPVKGCSRSEGGKGFKRKNEMIRHGLVHDSPGYVCPFCPDREHKYPRPDNLQRHVRVHHVDKDKDDPILRGVLSQRSDGPIRGRRRRGIPP